MAKAEMNVPDQPRRSVVGLCLPTVGTAHDTGPHHPERADRLRAIHRAVRVAGLVHSPDPFPEFSIDLGALPESVAPVTELALAEPASREQLLLVHPPEHIDRIQRVCAAGGGVLDQG